MVQVFSLGPNRMQSCPPGGGLRTAISHWKSKDFIQVSTSLPTGGRSKDLHYLVR